MSSTKYLLLQVVISDHKESGKNWLNSFMKDNKMKKNDIQTPMFYTNNGLYIIFKNNPSYEISQKIVKDFDNQLFTLKFINGIYFTNIIPEYKEISEWFINSKSQESLTTKSDIKTLIKTIDDVFPFLVVDDE